MNSFVTGDDSCHVSHLLQTDSKEISADLLKRKCIHLQLYEYMYHTAAARAGLRESLRETNTKRLAPMSPMSPTSAAGNSKRPASTAHTAPRTAAADRGAVEHLCQQPPLASNPGTTVPGTMGFALGLSLATAADTAAHALNDEQCPVTKRPASTAHTAPHAAAADRGAVEHLCQQPPLASNPGTTVPGPMGFTMGLSLAAAADTAAHATATALIDEQCPFTKPHQGPDPITNTKPHQGSDPITTVTKPHQGPDPMNDEQCPVTKPHQGTDPITTDALIPDCYRPFHGCVPDIEPAVAAHAAASASHSTAHSHTALNTAHDITHTTAHTAPHAAVADRGAAPAAASAYPSTTHPHITPTHIAAHATAAALNDEQCPATKSHQGTDPITTVLEPENHSTRNDGVVEAGVDREHLIDKDRMR